MEFEAIVESLSYKGLGVIKHSNGKIFYVEGVWPGDIGHFEITTEKKSYGYAKLNKLIKKSPDRRDPPCIYQGNDLKSCGGCSWMIANYPAQLREKLNILKSLARYNNLNINEFLSDIIYDQEFNYKNRAQIHKDDMSLGFHSKSSNQVIDIKECKILNPKTQNQLVYLRKNFNKIKTDKVFLDDRLDDSDLLHTNLGFNQGNTKINELIKTSINKYLTKHLKGLELFCGSGNYSKILKLKVDSLKAYDYKISNPISEQGITFVETDIYNKNFLDLLENNYDFLFLDPPRSGLKNLSQLVSNQKNLETIFYLSCDPSTMFRDIATLKKFKIIKVIPFDAYPQSAHLEALTILKRS